jgi:polar amino acid transport system substrate-binding protein
MNKFLSIFFGLFVWNFLGVSAHGQTIQILTEDYPPYNYMEKGQVTGFSTKIVEQVFLKAGIQGKPKLYPWARAYEMVLEKENTLIYTITRNSERENLFKWVGPLASRAIFLFNQKKRKDIEINSLEDAKKYIIGVTRDDGFSISLMKKGFEIGKNIYPVSKEEQNIEKLFTGRIDLVGNVELYMGYIVKSLGLDFNKLAKVYELPDKNAYYMALNKKTSDTIVNKLQHALDEIKQNGTYQNIADQYLK